MSNRKIHPKFKNMTEEEFKEWEKEFNRLNRDNINTYKLTQIKQGRGWIF